MVPRLENCLVGLISFMLATCTIYLTSDGRDIAAVWPANAVLLAALLDRRPGTEIEVFVAGFLANLAANAVMRGPSFGLPLYGLFNLVEIGVAARLLRPALANDGLLGAPSVVGRFIVVCGFVAPALSGIGGAATAYLAFGQDFWGSFVSWILSDSLGLLILTPFFYRVAARRIFPVLRRQGLAAARRGRRLQGTGSVDHLRCVLRRRAADAVRAVRTDDVSDVPARSAWNDAGGDDRRRDRHHRDCCMAGGRSPRSRQTRASRLSCSKSFWLACC